MHVLIVHAHPEPESFNGAMTRAAVEALGDDGHDVVVSDLYAQEFAPAAGRDDFLSHADATRFHLQGEQAHAASSNGFSRQLREQQAHLARADLLILQFPLWWGAPPAILKGWFDRVLAYGFAYVDAKRFDTGLLRGRRALISVTTGGTRARFCDGGVYGEIDKVLWPVRHLTLEYMGYDVEEPFVSYGIPRIDAPAREECLRSWRQRVVEVARKPVAPQPLLPAAALAAVGDQAWKKS